MNLHDLCKQKKLQYGKLIDYLKKNDVHLDRFSLDYLASCNPTIYRDIISQNVLLVASIIMTYKISGLLYSNNNNSQNKLIEIIKQFNIKPEYMFEQFPINF
jgi:hypothetical protein